MGKYLEAVSRYSQILNCTLLLGWAFGLRGLGVGFFWHCIFLSDWIWASTCPYWYKIRCLIVAFHCFISTCETKIILKSDIIGSIKTMS